MSGNLKHAVDQVILILKEANITEEAKSISFNSWSALLDSFKKIWAIGKAVVYATEIVYSEYHLVSEEERIKVAALVLDDLINFRGWAFFLESIDGYAFEMLLSAAVQSLNDKYGKGSWNLIPNLNIKAI